MGEFDHSIGDLRQLLEQSNTIRYHGRIRRLRQDLIESEGPHCQLGELCRLQSSTSGTEYLAEAVAIEENRVRLATYDYAPDLRGGDSVLALGHALQLPVGEGLLGRVVDPLLRPLDGGAPLVSAQPWLLGQQLGSAMDRPPVAEQLGVGIRALDALVPLGKGQRLGIFSGSGVGKTTLSSLIARYCQAEVTVLAMVGERGRELRDFIEHELGGNVPPRCILLFSSADSPALNRMRAAYSATAVAEYFCAQGRDVLLLVDSVSRFALAARELALAAGELPAQRGYPPSVASHLSRLVERVGRRSYGSISAIYNVLVEGDDLDEPIADTMRGLVDGHLVLSRSLAQQNHYPAIDVLASISRLERRICAPETLKAMGMVRRWLAVYRQHEDLLSVGAYSRGSVPELDAALAKIEHINAFLRQGVDEFAPLAQTLAGLGQLTAAGNS